MRRSLHNPSRPLRRIALVLLMTATTGCCAPLVRSERFGQSHAGGCESPAGEWADGMQAPCGPAEMLPPLIPDGIAAALRPLMHGMAGPFAPQEIVGRYQSTIRPPHSRFHPVPTRPVFATRADYAPPVPVQPPRMHHDAQIAPYLEPVPMRDPDARWLPSPHRPPPAVGPAPVGEPRPLYQPN